MRVLIVTNKTYHLFRGNNSEVLFVVNMDDWIQTPLTSTQRLIVIFLKCVYSILPITLAEKETYCDAFGAIPVYDITELAIIEIDWATNANGDKGPLYLEYKDKEYDHAV